MDNVSEELLKSLGYRPLPVPDDAEAAMAVNHERHYDHLHKGCQLSLPQYDDMEIGNLVRMTHRQDFHLETLVVAARDRIFCLAKEKLALEAELAAIKRREPSDG